MLTRHIYPGPPGITCLVSCVYLEGPGNPTLMRSGLCARILQQQHQLQQQLYHLKVRDIYNDEFHSKNDFRETMLLSGRHWHCFLWSICNECSKTQRYSESLQKSLGHIQQGLNNFVKYCFFTIHFAEHICPRWDRSLQSAAYQGAVWSQGSIC